MSRKKKRQPRALPPATPPVSPDEREAVASPAGRVILVVDLDERPGPNLARIGGVDYAFADHADDSPLRWLRYRAIERRALALPDSLDEADDAAWSSALAAFEQLQIETVRLALPTLPDDVLDRLGEVQRGAIIESYFGRGVAVTPTPDAPADPDTPAPGTPGERDATDTEAA